MSDVFDKLSSVSGLTRFEVDAIWEGVKANRKRLEECDHPHEFELVDQDKVVRNARCRKCGGVVVATNALWYIDGLAHASKCEGGSK
ncbi:MAG: hypothetical protein JXR97_16555 [Planctomycetes bacterium]|nr:hypothetical protein [Planctomycetota bacterium]